MESSTIFDMEPALGKRSSDTQRSPVTKGMNTVPTTDDIARLSYDVQGGVPEIVSIRVEESFKTDSQKTVSALVSEINNVAEDIEVAATDGIDVSKYWDLPSVADRPGVLNCLVQARAKLSSKDDYDSTALHIAAKYGCLEIVRDLLKSLKEPSLSPSTNNIDYVNIIDNNGQTALRYAVAYTAEKVSTKRASGEIVECLLEAKANTNCRNSKTESMSLWELCFLRQEKKNGKEKAPGKLRKLNRPKLEVASSLASRHMEIRREPWFVQVKRSLRGETSLVRTALHKDLSTDFTRGEPWYYVAVNEQTWIIALLRWIVEQNSTRKEYLPEVFDFITRHSLELNDAASNLTAQYFLDLENPVSNLNYREPGCVSEMLRREVESPKARKAREAREARRLRKDTKAKQAEEAKKAKKAKEAKEAKVATEATEAPKPVKPAKPAKPAKPEAREAGQFTKDAEGEAEEAKEAAELKTYSPDLLSIVMPYFYTDSWANIDSKRRKCHFKELTKSSEYCSGDPALHGLYLPLTLDEYCNPFLLRKTLQERNFDQVVTRYQERDLEKEEGLEPEEESRLIVVHQLWLWKIDEIIITAFPEELIQQDSIEATLKDTLPAAENNFLGISHLLSVLVDIIERPVMSGLSEPVFNIFERSITFVAEEVNQYLRDAVDVGKLCENKERQFFHQIGDIREELSMIKLVLSQQEDVWKQLISTIWPNNFSKEQFEIPINSVKPSEMENWNRIIQTFAHFKRFKERIRKLEEDADRVQNSITLNLDLKQKHATMKEAHSTAIMSAAVFGFTLITIIFTPLSFVLSLFALPIRNFQEHQIPSQVNPGSGMYTTNYIGKWAATAELVSITVILIAMWATVRFGMGIHVMNLLWQWLFFSKSIGHDESTIVTGPKGAMKATGINFEVKARSRLLNSDLRNSNTESVHMHQRSCGSDENV